MSYNPSSRPAQYSVPSLPPGYQQPLQRKNHAGGWIIGTVILLLLVGGGAYAYYAFQARSTPEKTLNAFCDGWKTGNNQEVSDQLDASAQKQFQLFEAVLKVPPKECAVSNVQENGSSATGTITITGDAFGRPLTQSSAVNLDQEQGMWKISGFENPQKTFLRSSFYV